MTKRGGALAQEPARLFAEIVPFFVLKIDHSSYARFEERPFAKWDVWMNIINVEADYGVSEQKLFTAFYGKEDAGWRKVNVFSSSVLRPLEWAGLLAQTREDGEGRPVYHVFKTPLWLSAIKLETDSLLKPVSVQ